VGVLDVEGVVGVLEFVVFSMIFSIFSKKIFILEYKIKKIFLFYESKGVLCEASYTAVEDTVKDTVEGAELVAYDKYSIIQQRNPTRRIGTTIIGTNELPKSVVLPKFVELPKFVALPKSMDVLPESIVVLMSLL
jgi:hypothetical protein